MRKAILVIALAAWACGEVTTAPEEAVPMRRIFSSWSSTITVARTEVISSRDRWVQVWKDLSSDPAPEIDFSRDVLLLAARGTEPTSACHEIEIVSVTRARGETVAKVVITDPGSRCICPPAVSNAVHVVAIPKMGQPVRFVTSSRVVDC